MFEALQQINARPKPFEFFTTAELWADEYISKRMLEYHLNGAVDVSSRRLEFIERSVDWMVERFSLDAGRKVADFGCGPGLYTNRLAAAGARVIGIDFSERSIRHARQSAQEQGLSVEHVHADYLKFETSERFDLITMIMCDFCALSPAQRRSLLASSIRPCNRAAPFCSTSIL